MNVFELFAKIDVDTTAFVKGMETIGKVSAAAMGAATLAVGKFALDSVQTGMEFDKAMSQVGATMLKTADEMEKEVGSVDTAFGHFEGNLRDFAQFLGKNTAFSATQAAEALNYMALAGYTTQESMDMLPNVLSLAAAGGFELARASDMVTDTQTAFGIDAKRTTQLVDEMAKAASTGNTSVEQLGDAFLTVGGLAKNLNGGMVELADGTTAEVDGIQELEIALTAMANAGIKGSEAGTHMRNMLLKLASPTEAGTQALEAMGVAVFDAEGNMRSLNDIFGDLNDAMSTMTQEEKLQAISDLFNTRDVAASEAILSAIGEDWNKIGEAILNAEGSASEMAEIQLDNLAGDVTLFKSALEGAQIVISDQLTPTLRDFVQFGTESLGRLSDAFEEGGLSQAGEVFGEILSEGVTKIVELAPTVVEAASQLLSAFIEGLIGALPTLIEALPSMVESFVQLLTEVIMAVAEALPDIIRGLAVAIPQIIEIVAEALNEIITGLIEVLPEVISALMEALPEIIVALVDAVPTILEGVGTAIIENFPIIIEAILEGLANVLVAIGGWFVHLFTDVDEHIDELSKNLKEKSQSFEAFTDVIKNTEPQLAEWNTLVSESGHTLDELDSSIRENESAITEVIRTALQEQGELREADIKSIEEYLDNINKLNDEKMQIYASQQKAQLQKLQLDSNNITKETAAQHLANTEAALDAANQATEDAYTARLASLENTYTAMGEAGSKAHEQEKAEAKAAHDAQIAENQRYADEAYRIVAEASTQWVDKDRWTYNMLSNEFGQFKKQNMTDLDLWLDGVSDTFGGYDKAKESYLKALGEITVETDNAYLLLLAQQKASGQELTDEQKQIASEMIAPFDDMLPQFDDLGKDTLLGLARGMEETIPELTNASEMSSDEISDTIKEALGIASPSTVMREVGENTIQGLVEGIESEESSLSSAMSDIAESMSQPFSGMSGDFYSIGAQLMGGLANGIYSNSGAVTSAAVNAVTDAINAAKAAGDIKSPSRKMAWVGEMLSKGLGKGIADNESYAIDAASDMIDGIEDAIDYPEPLFDTGSVSETILVDTKDDTQALLTSILQRLDNMEYTMYSSFTDALTDGVEWRWNDRELGRMVKSYA